MAYRRRYLSGQAATTVVIAEGAITSDKIVDGAVTHPKISPGAVDSERVIDGSLKSVDIKDGEIKSVDIASGAITTDKIASQAVTVDKLEASIQGIARPLTPGVDTAEIQDGKVTLAKLAPGSVDASKIKSGAVGPTELAANAVETDRVKDGAISTAKIAGSAIDATKIAVDAVTGSEILNRSVGTTEIAIDGVQSENIKNLNVTSDKLNLNSVITSKILEKNVTSIKLGDAMLAKRHLSSKMARIKGIHEEFIGGVLPDEWTAVVAAGGLISPDGIQGLSIVTGALNGDDIVVTSDHLGYILETLPFFDAQILFQQLTNRDLFVGVEDGGANRVGFASGTGPGSTNLWAQCDYADGAVYVDTGIIADTFTQHILAFEVVDATSVKFYVDGILKATIPSTIPATTPVFPKIEFIARAAGGKELNIRYLSLLMDKP